MIPKLQFFSEFIAMDGTKVVRMISPFGGGRGEDRSKPIEIIHKLIQPLKLPVLAEDSGSGVSSPLPPPEGEIDYPKSMISKTTILCEFTEMDGNNVIRVMSPSGGGWGEDRLLS